ncbi:DUF6266 family protein [Sphingobacterium multivorum]|uniref:DUF6266 family protein n=3 Tax=Sphingobacterium TaxID=28453 RepID=A0ACD5C0U7_9SPHI|nr:MULTISPECIES: DUF6266 family protein [Sphingobacterium]OFV11312.1 hypothetical protein HMPREF3127_19905 [Sphingobacterium sp. HMSC13C05]QQT46909.1 hypothetical protein I6J00_09735 [Sphingobacterium multivorum]QQT60550.1 hypothetical protein I6I97_15075 [Sphingobacterium multivorum]QRQ62394.1 hypothetical protein I6J33_05275 [Sphingobacterium multivorum]TWI16576.1 hypothetical protein IQ31_04274 [Sphingobacterium siyangense]
MGTIVNGINGGISGKTGSVIGSSWKSINYLKGLYKKSNKPASQEQLITQAKFKLLMRFLMPINSYLQVGFGQKKADRQTPLNAAFQFNLPLAIQGTYPGFTLDYSKIRIADGAFFLGPPQGASFADEEMTVTWDSNNNDIYGSADDDGVYIIGYHPEQDEFLAPSIVPTRQVGTTTFVVPAHLLGGSAHLWIFMADRKKKRVSKSSYLGLIQLI